MRILISTGIFPPDIGGPAIYAKNLRNEFLRRGFGVKVATFGFEKKLPSGIRHAAFFAKILWSIAWAERIILLDTMSAAVPTIAAAKLFGKPVVVRIGGDFLWESYVERTHDRVPLNLFYSDESCRAKFTGKEKLIFKLTKYVLNNSEHLAFTTAWQKDIWKDAYGFDGKKASVIGNYIGEKLPSFPPERKLFLWAGRAIFLKNVDLLKKAFEAAKDILPDLDLECVQVSQEELLAKIAHCYAVIVPSLSEVSPNLAYDAVRFDKPLILTEHNGIRDVLGEAALPVDPLNAEEIKEKILWLADADNYRLQCERSRRFGRTHSWKEIAGEFLALFENK